MRVNVSASASFHGVTFKNNGLTDPLSDQVNGPIAKLSKDSVAAFTDCSFEGTTAAVCPQPMCNACRICSFHQLYQSHCPVPTPDAERVPIPARLTLLMICASCSTHFKAPQSWCSVWCGWCHWGM